MRVLIFGANGMLGQDLLPAFAGHDAIGLGSLDADLRDAPRILEVVQKARPEWTILSAAYADVDGCEGNPERAFAVNRDGAINVANAALQTRSRLLFVSTDYVFDGTKNAPYEIDDRRNPINVYGRSKAEAETGLLEILPDCCIVRTSWLFGKGGKCFPDTILKLAKTRAEIRVVNDQRGCPSYTVDLARAICELTARKAEGIVHATNRGNCSWYEFAHEILAAKNSSTIVQPTTTAEFPRPAKRPAYSTLSDASLSNLGLELPPWQDALQRYLSARGN